MDSSSRPSPPWNTISKLAREHLALLLDDPSALTQSRHAELAQLSRQVISAYERGVKEPGYTAIDRMLYALGLEMKWHLVPVGEGSARPIRVEIGNDAAAISIPDYGGYEKIIRQYFFWPGMLIRSARIKSAVTQSQLAALSGTTQSAISAYEHDSHQPSLSTLERIVHSVALAPVVTIIPYDDSTELHWRHQANYPEASMDRVRQWREEYLGIAERAKESANRLGYRPNPLIDQRYLQYRRSLLEHLG